MASITDVFTTPAKKWITPASSGVWAVDFANMIDAGEAITDASARIFATLTRTVVDGAIVTVAIDGTTDTQVNVQWDAADLSPGVAYRLETTAVLDTDTDDLVLYTDLVVV